MPQTEVDFLVGESPAHQGTNEWVLWENELFPIIKKKSLTLLLSYSSLFVFTLLTWLPSYSLLIILLSSSHFHLLNLHSHIQCTTHLLYCLINLHNELPQFFSFYLWTFLLNSAIIPNSPSFAALSLSLFPISFFYFPLSHFCFSLSLFFILSSLSLTNHSFLDLLIFFPSPFFLFANQSFQDLSISSHSLTPLSPPPNLNLFPWHPLSYITLPSKHMCSIAYYYSNFYLFTSQPTCYHLYEPTFTYYFYHKNLNNLHNLIIH